MKTNEINIKIETLEEFRQRTREELEDIEEGEQQTFKEEILSFQSIEQMREFLTPKRIELLKTIRHEQPESIYELAKMVDRTPANVNQDVNRLANLGLIELEKTDTARKKVRPKVRYDKIKMEMAV